MFKKILTLLALLATSLAMAAVDVNKATEAELDSVKGIGPTTSKAILAERKKSEFKNWDDFIERVKGLGEARAGKLSEAGLRVNGRAYQNTAAKSDAKADKKEAKADTKAEKKEPKADKVEAKADRKEAKAEAKAEAAKPAVAASGKK